MTRVDAHATTVALWRWSCSARRLFLLGWLGSLPLVCAATQELVASTVCEQFTSAACVPRDTALPYHWDWVHGQSDGSARFTLRFDARAFLPNEASVSTHAPAVFLPRVGNAFSIAFNGVEVLAVGVPGTQRVDTVKRPYLVALPDEAVQEHNILTITIHAQAGRGAQLLPVVVGHQTDLLPAFEREMFWRVQLTAILMWAGVLLGLMGLAVWVVQREAVFLAYAIAEIAWSLRLSEMFAVEMPLDWQVWGAGVAALFGTAQLAMTFFFPNAVDRWHGRLRQSYWVYVGLWAVVVPMVVILRLRTLWIVWLAIGTAMFIGLALFVSWRSFKDRHFWRWMFAAFVLSMVVAGVFDMLESPGSMYLHPTWTRLVWGGFSIGLALLVGRRLQRARTAMLASNSAMQRALADQEIKLLHAHEKQAEADFSRAMSEERQRVMRDMHDGLGAQLSSLLSMVGRSGTPLEELQGQVRSAIDELRMVVDAMTPFDGNIAAMLGSLRPQLERRLQRSGIALEWAVDGLPQTPHLSPVQVQHLQRILLEAVTNIVKHSGARIARLSARSDQGSIELQLSDNGTGFGTTSSAAGNGLRNMQWRAKALGATLTIASQRGTSLRLVLPVPA